jgi:hypothetical protein
MVGLNDTSKSNDCSGRPDACKVSERLKACERTKGIEGRKAELRECDRVREELGDLVREGRRSRDRLDDRVREGRRNRDVLGGRNGLCDCVRDAEYVGQRRVVIESIVCPFETWQPEVLARFDEGSDPEKYEFEMT